MLQKIKRLLEIPEPHRSGMVRRVLEARFPERAARRSSKYMSQLSARAGQNKGDGGGRYLLATAHRTAGIGHALSEYNTGLLMARGFGLEFLHSSLASPWEEFLGFASGYTAAEPFWKQGDFELVRLPRVDWKAGDPIEELRSTVDSIRSSGNLLFVPFDGQNSFVQHTTGSELRKIYWFYKQRSGEKVLREPGCLNVAVHIRRRNAMDMKNPSVHDTSGAEYRARYLDLEYFEILMQSILTALPEERVVFHIFSQGTPDGFEPLLRFGDVRLHLDVDQYNTFHNMACADVLITSPSSFSYKAGMLNPGLKLTRYPWWHEVPQDEEWCRIPEDPGPSQNEVIDFLKQNRPSAMERARQLFPFEL